MKINNNQNNFNENFLFFDALCFDTPKWRWIMHELKKIVSEKSECK